MLHAQIPVPINIQINKVFGDFEKLLQEEEIKMPPLYGNIQAVKRNLENIKKLIRTELQNAQGFQIDFIPQYELGTQKNVPKWAHDSIERYQKAVKGLLVKSNYDLIGWEGTSLDTINHMNFKNEVLKNWYEVAPNFRMDTSYFFVWYASQYAWQDGVLGYWALHPKANLTGLQESSLWKLNVKANELDTQFSLYVSELRSYVAMAKILRAIKNNPNKKSRTVMVMGAWHQKDIMLIVKALGIKVNIINVQKNY